MRGNNCKQPSQAQSHARPFFQKWPCFSESSAVIAPNESFQRTESKIDDLSTRAKQECTLSQQVTGPTTRRHSSNGRASELEEYLGAAASKRWLLRRNQSPPISLQVLEGRNLIESTNPTLSTELTKTTITTPNTSAATLLNLSSYYKYQSPSPALQDETMAECGSFTLTDKQSTISSSSSSADHATTTTTTITTTTTPTPTTPRSGDTKSKKNANSKSSNSSPKTLMIATSTPQLSERPPGAANNVRTATTTTTNSGSGSDGGATLLHLSPSTAHISLQTTNSTYSNAPSPIIPTDNKQTNTNNNNAGSNSKNHKHSSTGSSIIRKHSAVMIIPAEAEVTLPTTVQRKISDVCDGHHVRLAKLKAQMGNMAVPPSDLLSLMARKVFSQQGHPGGLGGRVRSDGMLSDLIVDSRSSMATATASPPVEEEDERDEMPVVMDLPPIKTKVASR